MTVRSVLLIFAHPDDETVFAGGVASRYADAGARVALCTATLGERGKTGTPPVCEADQLGRVRQAELVAAAALIGVSTLRVFGYPDCGLQYAPPDLIRRQLVEAIRAVRPQVVITFDPNGSNLHPDHIAISRFAGDAVAAAADPRFLPEVASVHAVRRVLWTLPVRPWDVVSGGDPSRVAGVDFVVDVARWKHRKAAALRAHQTQHASLDRIMLSKPDVDRLLSIELFRQAWGPPTVERPSDDIFDGIEANAARL
ncbi:MAG: PIG-L deacetylase family protein [Acidobacteriota bacterium]